MSQYEIIEDTIFFNDMHKKQNYIDVIQQDPNIKKINFTNYIENKKSSFGFNILFEFLNNLDINNFDEIDFSVVERTYSHRFLFKKIYDIFMNKEAKTGNCLVIKFCNYKRLKLNSYFYQDKKNVYNMIRDLKTKNIDVMLNYIVSQIDKIKNEIIMNQTNLQIQQENIPRISMEGIVDKTVEDVFDDLKSNNEIVAVDLNTFDDFSKLVDMLIKSENKNILDNIYGIRIHVLDPSETKSEEKSGNKLDETLSTFIEKVEQLKSKKNNIKISFPSRSFMDSFTFLYRSEIKELIDLGVILS